MEKSQSQIDREVRETLRENGATKGTMDDDYEPKPSRSSSSSSSSNDSYSLTPPERKDKTPECNPESWRL